MATLILIHGGWHGGWCWEEVVPLLEARGHAVLAPDLPGMGVDRTPWAEDVLGQWTAFVAALVEARSEPAVLVGHSRGGLLVSAVTERLPDRIARAIYVCAFLLADGENWLDIENHGEMGKAAHLDPATNRLVPDGVKAIPALYGHVPPDAAARAAARLTDEPFQSFTHRVRLTPERFGRVPRAYIETTDDRTIPLAKQREMQRRWPCDPVVTLESDHSPFLSMPDRLADALDALARCAGPGRAGAAPEPAGASRQTVPRSV